MIKEIKQIVQIYWVLQLELKYNSFDAESFIFLILNR